MTDKNSENSESKKEFRTEERKEIPKRSLRSVKLEICGMLGVTEEDLAGKSRSKTIVLARKLFTFKATNETGASLSEIGRELGHRDHTVVRYYLQEFKKEYKTEKEALMI